MSPSNEMQEDVVEMQGEDPNAQSTMQDVPNARMLTISPILLPETTAMFQ